MIVASLLLILVAVALLVGGLASGSSVLLVGSIAASLLAAIVLVVGARQAAARADGTDPATPDGGPGGDVAGGAAHRRPRGARTRETVDADTHDTPQQEADGGVGHGAGYARHEATAGDAPPEAATDQARHEAATDQARHEAATETAPTIPAQVGGVGVFPAADPDEPAYGEADEDEDPPDEPAAQYVTPTDAARVARLTSEVFVIDGRPRYHLSSCLHLLGRDSEPLPVAEAIGLGFSPCSLCEPDSALLAGAPRV